METLSALSELVSSSPNYTENLYKELSKILCLNDINQWCPDDQKGILLVLVSLLNEIEQPLISIEGNLLALAKALNKEGTVDKESFINFLELDFLLPESFTKTAFFVKSTLEDILEKNPQDKISEVQEIIIKNLDKELKDIFKPIYNILESIEENDPLKLEWCIQLTKFESTKLFSSTQIKTENIEENDQSNWKSRLDSILFIYDQYGFFEAGKMKKDSPRLKIYFKETGEDEITEVVLFGNIVNCSKNKDGIEFRYYYPKSELEYQKEETKNLIKRIVNENPFLFSEEQFEINLNNLFKQKDIFYTTKKPKPFLTHVGEFSNYKYDGKGEVYGENGNMKFEGIFADHKAKGHGISYFADGATIRYKGNYLDGEPDGIGTLYNEMSNIRYIGEWSNGLPHGKGKTYYPTGELYYEGDYKKGKFWGEGTKYQKSGTIYHKGNYIDGKAWGFGNKYNKDGTLYYKGKHKDNRFNGYGQLYDGEGILQYEGDFRDNYEYGKGILYNLDGEIEYEGAIIDGKPHPI